jgi:negative regulator of replication initiation
MGFFRRNILEKKEPSEIDIAFAESEAAAIAVQQLLDDPNADMKTIRESPEWAEFERARKRFLLVVEAAVESRR